MTYTNILLILALVPFSCTMKCLECMESRVEIGNSNTADPGPSFSPSCSAEHNVTTCPRVRADPGCFMIRVSHGGHHYGVSITNRMIHRGCRHGNEETMCDQIRSHLGPLTVGAVYCKVELCEGDLCNAGVWGEEGGEEVDDQGGADDKRGGTGGSEAERKGRGDFGQTQESQQNGGIAAAQTNFEGEKMDEKTDKNKESKKKRGKDKKGGKNKKMKRKKRRKVKSAKLSRQRKL